MSKELDEEVELSGLIGHLEGALSNMDNDFFCRVHGQAVESALAKLRLIYKPEPAQYVVEMDMKGGLYRADCRGHQSYAETVEEVTRKMWIKIRLASDLMGGPDVTMEQIKFVEV